MTDCGAEFIIRLKASNKSPGEGSNETLGDCIKDDFRNLSSIDHWRRVLAYEYASTGHSFTYKDRVYSSIQTAVYAQMFPELPDIQERFDESSGHQLSHDHKYAKAFSSKKGVLKGEQIRDKDIPVVAVTDEIISDIIREKANQVKQFRDALRYTKKASLFFDKNKTKRAVLLESVRNEMFEEGGKMIEYDSDDMEEDIEDDIDEEESDREDGSVSGSDIEDEEEDKEDIEEGAEESELPEKNDSDDEEELFEFDKNERNRVLLNKYHTDKLFISNNEIQKACTMTQKDTQDWLSRFEIARILSFRTRQLIEGAEPYINNVDHLSEYEIAKQEMTNKKLPFILKRPLPNGTFVYRKLHQLDILTSEL